jgi:hypothetical protein
MKKNGLFSRFDFPLPATVPPCCCSCQQLMPELGGARCEAFAYCLIIQTRHEGLRPTARRATMAVDPIYSAAMSSVITQGKPSSASAAFASDFISTVAELRTLSRVEKLRQECRALCKPPPQCSDGVDNDQDGKTDFPADPGCSSVTDESESPDPPRRPQCSDGMDNDQDGKADIPADPGCSSATDDSESPDPPPRSVSFLCPLSKVIPYTGYILYLGACGNAFVQPGTVTSIRYVPGLFPMGLVYFRWAF